MAWGKIKFFYETMLGKPGSTLVATSTESDGDHNVDYIYNMLEINNWQAEDSGLADPQYITFDAGAGNAYSADYLILSLTNLFTIGATVTLQNSDDNFTADVNDIAAIRPTEDSLVFQEFTEIVNPGFESWSYGTSNPPDGWGFPVSAITREDIIVKSGTYSAKTVRSGTNTTLRRIIVNYGYYQNKTVTFGCWGYTTTAGAVILRIADSTASAYSAYHLGGGGWEFLTVTKTIGASITYLWLELLIINIDSTAYFDGPIFKIASSMVSTDKNDYIQPNSNAQRYWQLKIAGHGSTAPYATLALWGNTLELDWAQSSFDPHAERVEANVTKSYAGYLTGIHTRSSERSMTISFNDADATLYDKIKAWWDDSGVNNIFVGWNTKDNPDEVFLMRPGTSFNNPYELYGTRRRIRISLKGRKA